jgi:two-component system, OmpR family, sensor histidine kinase KdpD
LVEDRARFIIFFGSSAGVGKTYQMLSEARVQFKQGVDVRIGFVETHGRKETADMIDGIPVIPRRRIDYHGTEFEEMDTDEVIRQHPRIALVDELAHTNIPGSRHKKRYEDIEEILQNGIEVWSTVNVQHLDSLNDIVFELTGVKVRETFPDRILERADEIRLIDISPEALLERLRAGKVYTGDKIDRALSNFFLKNNLMALRQLSLREVADEVREDLSPLNTQLSSLKERIIVCLVPGSNPQRLVRIGWRMSKRLNGDLMVVYVRHEPTFRNKLDAAEDARITALKALSETLSAEFIELVSNDPARDLLKLAGQKNATQLLLERPTEECRTGKMSKTSLLSGLVKEPNNFINMHIVCEEDETLHASDGR